MTTVVTAWHPAGYAEYGRNFLATFERHWPKDVRLLAYIEDTANEIDVASRAELRSLWVCEGVREFLSRHKGNLEAKGLKECNKWRDRDRGKPYNFRFDAVKFCKQLFVPHHAADTLRDGEILTWLDGDVMTTADVPGDLLGRLIGDADLSYLGRSGTHSEIGYWSVRLNDGTRAFLKALADTYSSDAVLNLKEWHSAFVFDYCRAVAEKHGVKTMNLTPGGAGHVWFSCRPLAACTDHLKGRRKALGRSPERR